MQQLDEAGIETVLRGMGYGFIGLARDDRPYVIPISFGYDGATLYFQLNATGRKFDYIDDPTSVDDATSASFAVLDVDRDTGTSRSVLVEGALAEVPTDEAFAAYEAIADNAVFATDLEVWGYPLHETELRLFKLEPTTMSGRVFGAN